MDGYSVAHGRPEGLRERRPAHRDDRIGDRIEVVASWDAPLADHATLCVDAVDGAGKATVSLLLRYERQP